MSKHGNAVVEGEVQRRGDELAQRYMDSVSSEFQRLTVKLHSLFKELKPTHGPTIASYVVQKIYQDQLNNSLKAVMDTQGRLQFLINTLHAASQQYNQELIKEQEKTE